MARLELKEFQKEVLTAIGTYCDEVNAAKQRQAMRPPHDAFYAMTQRDYIEVPQLTGVPYVCIRVPTGGGKTLIASHAVGRISQRLLRTQASLCLWVTPSTTIRDQTLRGLKNREHPYFDAVRESLGGPFEVATIEEALGTGRLLQPGNATIIVTTIQSYRIDNEENDRRIYRENGSLMDAHPVLSENRQIEPSLTNAIRLRTPIVIIDEAHNARTRVSFDSLARFGPSFVLELTATPSKKSDPESGEYASNVLHAVSALQLAQPGQRMIKLPIELESRETADDVLIAAKEKREALAAEAATYANTSGRSIRPIALIQAQARNKNRETITADKVKKILHEKLGIDESRIRIVTGDTDELGAEDVRSPDSVVEYIITVDKLREGWDCPTAYVLGSIGNAATPTAVEQLMGRVLRMPDATETNVAMLDRAYAIVLSDDVLETARNLERGLVNTCGFDESSAADALRTPARANRELFGSNSIAISPGFNPAGLPVEVRRKVTVDTQASRMHIATAMTQPEMRILRDAMPTAKDKQAVETFWTENRQVGVASKPLDQYVEPFRIPQLAVVKGSQRILFEPIELEEYQWNLQGCDPTLANAAFSIELDIGDKVTIGLTARGGVDIGDKDNVIVTTLSRDLFGDEWESPLLVRWLNTELHRGERFAGLTQSESQAWVLRVAEHLVKGRGADVKVLARKRFELVDVLAARLAAHGNAQLKELASALIDGRTERKLITSDEFSFPFREDAHVPGREYSGEFRSGLKKHAFSLIGDMNKPEALCAKRIDGHPNVKRWVRNPSYASSGGFSLPTSPGRFFPDFIVELIDGRMALVEYKGDRAEKEEEQRKKLIGELWEARSQGKCIFVWIENEDWDTLEAKLTAAEPVTAKEE